MDDTIDELIHLMTSTVLSRRARNAIEAAIKELRELRAFKRGYYRPA